MARLAVSVELRDYQPACADAMLARRRIGSTAGSNRPRNTISSEAHVSTQLGYCVSVLNHMI